MMNNLAWATWSTPGFGSPGNPLSAARQRYLLQVSLAVGWRGSISLSVKTAAKLVKTSVVLTVEEAVEAAGFFSP